jgi:hypothetical protein
MEGRIKAKDLPVIKKQLIAKQGGICPLCSGTLYGVSPINVVVDHCHGKGHIRAALHRGCNGVEGKVKSLITSFGRTPDPRIFLKNLLTYWELHKVPQTEWVHHTFKTPEEKRASRNKKSRAAYAAKKAS